MIPPFLKTLIAAALFMSPAEAEYHIKRDEEITTLSGIMNISYSDAAYIYRFVWDYEYVKDTLMANKDFPMPTYVPGRYFSYYGKHNSIITTFVNPDL